MQVMLRDTDARAKAAALRPREAAPKDINQSARDYHRWLESVLGDAFAAEDLDRKWRKMAAGPFAFLRATYWRWAETVAAICPELMSAPQALCVGDTHIENFGTWRDAEGRLVWGVNDFDEAAVMPFPLDLVRLAASAILARGRGAPSAREICAEILSGYKKGLKTPGPFVLDHDNKWLRKLVVVPEGDRADFWSRLFKLDEMPRPPADFAAALARAVPEAVTGMRFARRVAGSGSLGRLRIVGTAQWRGAPLVREAKAVAPSAWIRAAAPAEAAGIAAIEIATIARGRFRSPDPWYRLDGRVLTRRLSPNNRKLDGSEGRALLLRPDILGAMGHDIAAIHAATVEPEILRGHLKARPKGWLFEAAARMAAVMIADQKDFDLL